MSEYTPTTEQVRGAYAAYVPTYVGPREQAFDRWRAQNNAEVRRQIAEEIADAIRMHCGWEGDAYQACIDCRILIRIARKIGDAS